MKQILVGRYHEIRKIHNVRTAEQRKVVEQIISRKDFDFACCNPFEADDNFRCSFYFLWYDNKGKLHGEWITPTGRIRSVNVPDPPMNLIGGSRRSFK